MRLRCNHLATDFNATDWRLLRPLQQLYVHIWNYSMIADQSAIGFATAQWLIGNLSETVSHRYGDRLAIYWDRSVTSRRMFGDWLQLYGDWSVTSWRSITDRNKIHIKMCLSESNYFSASWQDVNSRTVAVAENLQRINQNAAVVFSDGCAVFLLFFPVLQTKLILMIKQLKVCIIDVNFVNTCDKMML